VVICCQKAISVPETRCSCHPRRNARSSFSPMGHQPWPLADVVRRLPRPTRLNRRCRQSSRQHRSWRPDSRAGLCSRLGAARAPRKSIPTNPTESIDTYFDHVVPLCYLSISKFSDGTECVHDSYRSICANMRGPKRSRYSVGVRCRLTIWHDSYLEFHQLFWFGNHVEFNYLLVRDGTEQYHYQPSVRRDDNSNLVIDESHLAELRL